MPHGDFSDIAALSLIATGITHMAAPAVLFDSIGPFAAAYHGELTPHVEALVRIMGSFILAIGFILSTVRWNPTNGKLSGIGCIIAGINMAYAVLSLDDNQFVLRPSYVLAGIFVLAGLHTMFNPNPHLPKPEAKGK
eukprot:INCI19292.1.p1 GENE.INCI19292.1~~INCI19292.1.p1  ORF type:complete len:156 (-),score=22.23 INCI19292.1:201-611(-)